MEFSRQEYWRGLSLPSPGDLPENPGIKLMSPALADRFFTTEPPGKPGEKQGSLKGKIYLKELDVHSEDPHLFTTYRTTVITGQRKRE